MAIPGVSDVARIPRLTNRAVGADQNPLGSPFIPAEPGGSVEWKRSGNALSPAFSWWCDAASSSDVAQRSPNGFGVVFGTTGTLPTTGVTWFSATRHNTGVTEGDPRGYIIRVDWTSGSVELRRGDESGSVYLDGSTVSLTTGMAFALVVNPDGVAAFVSPDDSTWSRVAFSNDVTHFGSYLAALGGDGQVQVGKLYAGELILAPTAPKMNPAVIHYWNAPIDLTWASDGAIIVVDTNGPKIHRDFINNARVAGAEVLQYVIFSNPHPDGSPNQIERQRLYTYDYSVGGTVPAQYIPANFPTAWYWDTANPSSHAVGSVDVGNIPAADLRVGSAWANQVVAWFTDWLTNRAGGTAQLGAVDGLFLDVFGFWSDNLIGFSPLEKEQWAAGTADLARRLRQAAEAIGGSAGDVLLVANNTWQASYGQPQGSQYLDGYCIENHDISNLPFHEGQMQGTWRGVRNRFIVICRENPALARQWYDAEHSGTHLTCGDYEEGGLIPLPLPIQGGTVPARGWLPSENHIQGWSPLSDVSKHALTADFSAFPAGSNPPGPTPTGTSWHRTAADRTLVVSDNVYRGERAIRIDCRPGDVTASGHRTEFYDARDYLENSASAASTYFYGTAVYLPDGTETWRDDVQYETGDTWGVVFQTHQKDSIPGAPPIALHADRWWDLGNKISFYLSIRGGNPASSVQNDLFFTWDEDVLGRWYAFIFGVTFATDNTGSVQGWMRREGETLFTPVHDGEAGYVSGQWSGIPTALVGDDASYRKGGIYAGDDDQRFTLYHHGYRRALTYAEVEAWLNDAPVAPAQQVLAPSLLVPATYGTTTATVAPPVADDVVALGRTYDVVSGRAEVAVVDEGPNPPPVTPGGVVIAQWVAPFLTIPHVAGDALTLRIRLALTPQVVEYRHWEVGAPVPPWQVVHTFDGSRKSVDDFVTFDGLVSGRNYRFQARLNGEHYVSTDVVWSNGATLFPAVDTSVGNAPRPWVWEDFLGQWLASLAWYYRSDPLIDRVLHRISDEFQRLGSAVEQVVRGSFPSLATGASLRAWEQVLNVDIPESVPEGQRRALVLALVRLRTQSSALTFEQMLTYLLGSAPRIVEDFGGYSVFVELPGNEALREAVKRLIERIKPAHIEVTYDAQFFQFIGPRTRAPIVAAWPRTVGLGEVAPGTGLDEGVFDV